MDQDKNFQLGELTGTVRTLVSVITENTAKIEKLSDDFGKMEKGRLTAAELKINTLELQIKNDQRNEKKTSDRVWDLTKIILPTLISTIGFLLLFWFNNN